MRSLFTVESVLHALTRTRLAHHSCRKCNLHLSAVDLCVTIERTLGGFVDWQNKHPLPVVLVINSLIRRSRRRRRRRRYAQNVLAATTIAYTRVWTEIGIIVCSLVLVCDTGRLRSMHNRMENRSPSNGWNCLYYYWMSHTFEHTKKRRKKNCTRENDNVSSVNVEYESVC